MIIAGGCQAKVYEKVQKKKFLVTSIRLRRR